MRYAKAWMDRGHARRAGRTLLGWMLSMSLSAALHAEEPGPGDEGDPGMIVVTATKRAQSLEELNGSITVVSGEQLEQSQVRDTNSLGRVLPGVQIGYGSSQLFPTIALRGVTTAQDFYNPALTFYIDGVPQMPVLAMQALVDVQQVELLRGPQGTLFGKSAEGGIVNIVTRQPNSKVTAWLEAGASSHAGYDAKGSLSGPLINGSLYGSVTVLAQSQPGNLRNPATGTDNLNGSRSQAANAHLRLAPDAMPWEVNLNVAGECTHAHQDAYVPFDDIHQSDIWSTGNAPDPYLDRCSHSESLLGSYQSGDWKATALASWQRLHYSNFYPWDVYVNWQPERWRQNVQELRLATQGEHRLWDAVFGLYHQDIRQHRDATFSAYDPELPNDSAGPYSHGDSHLHTLAAYSDGTLHLTRRLHVGAGIRVSRDEASTRFSGTESDVLGPGEEPDFSGQGQTERTHVLGQLSAGYELYPHWDTYVRLAQGYKPTGFNLAPASPFDASAYAAEESLNYELGTRFTRDTISLQAALFRTETRRMQLYTGTLGYQVITNAGKAQANGAELDFRWKFLPDWTLGLDGAATAARFNKFDYSEEVSYTGNRLPYVPRFIAGAHLQGDLKTTLGTVQPGIDFRAVGRQQFDLANTLSQAPYNTVDLRLGWNPTEHVQLTAYALNVADRRYRTFGIDSGFSGPIAEVNLGRIIGVNARIGWF